MNAYVLTSSYYFFLLLRATLLSATWAVFNQRRLATLQLNEPGGRSVRTERSGGGI